MSKQLELFSSYECDPRGATGINIWTRDSSDSFYGYPDLHCDIKRAEGQYVDFYVINGDWDGRLDLANKTMTIFHPWYKDTVHTYDRYEFIYEKPEKVLDADSIPY